MISTDLEGFAALRIPAVASIQQQTEFFQRSDLHASENIWQVMCRVDQATGKLGQFWDGELLQQRFSSQWQGKRVVHSVKIENICGQTHYKGCAWSAANCTNENWTTRKKQIPQSTEDSRDAAKRTCGFRPPYRKTATGLPDCWLEVSKHSGRLP